MFKKVGNRLISLMHLAVTIGLITMTLAGGVVSAREPALVATQKPFVQFELNIPGVSEAMLNASYWLQGVKDEHDLIMTPGQIERYNRQGFRDCEVLKDLHV